LKAEKSTSLNLGIVFEPTKDFNTSVDFYRIRWNNVVASPKLQDIVDASCPAGPPCPSTAQVIRDPNNNNQVVTVISNYQNLSSRVTSGLDFDVRYGIPTVAAGKFTARLNANYILKFQEDNADGQGAHSVNDSNAGVNTIPRLKVSSSLDWDYGPLSITTKYNYTKGWRQAAFADTNAYYLTTNTPQFQTGTLRKKTPDYYTFDPYGRYQINKNFSTSASVVNLFNRTPPYDPGFTTTYFYDFSQFDVRGRLYRLSLTYKM